MPAALLRTIGLALAAALLGLLPIEAVSPERDFTQLLVDAWTTHDGLPQDTVQAIAQTPDGLLWVGTESGLARFDGHRFVPFRPAARPGLRETSITALRVTRDGALWIGTGTGEIFRLAGETLTEVAAPIEPLGVVWTLVEDAAHVLWVGSNRGLHRVVRDRIEDVHATIGAVLAIGEGPDGALWLGGSGGLHERRNNRLRTFTAADGFIWTRVNAVVVAPDGRVWVGLRSSGVVVHDRGRWTRVDAAARSVGPLVQDLLQDRHGNVWVGTWNGLARVGDDRARAPLSQSDRMPTAVRTLFEDRAGDLWVGTRGGGLYRVRQGAVTTHTVVEGLTRNDLQAVCTDRLGRVFVGTSDVGMDVLAGGRWQRVAAQGPLARATVWACSVDAAGTVWLGTSEGLFAIGPATTARVPLPPGESGSIVYSVFATTRLGVWLVTDEQVFVVAGGEMRPISIAGTPVSAVLGESSDGTVYLARDDELVAWKDGATRLVWRAPDARHEPVALLVREGTLWIGTAGAGLVRLRATGSTTFGRDAGLPDLTVGTILDDGRGSYWLATHGGIVRVSAARLDRATDSTPLEPIVYTMRDGLRSHSVDERGQPSGALDAHGRLWFATTRGIAEIDPSRLPTSEQRTGVFVDEVRVDGEARRDGEVAPAGRGSLRVRFSTTGRISSPHVRFRFRLEGFDRDWVAAGPERDAHYTNVPPGRYRFVVAAADETSDWGPDEAAVTIELAPHWYQTRGFFILLVASLVGAGAGLAHLRARQSRRQAAHLARVVEVRTRELRAEIAEREHAERRLRESEQQYRALAAELDARVHDRTRDLEIEVHERRRAQAELVLARDAAESSSRTKGAFLANMSHELRTPLNAIIGYSELLTEDVAARQIDGLAADLSRIQSAGRHLLALVNDVLDYARVEAGQLAVHPEAFGVHDLAASAVSVVSGLAARQGNTLDMSVHAAVGRMVSDPVRVRQVLVNLLSNACKFTENGTITLEISLSTDGPRPATTFVVRDTGIGIAPEDLPKLFLQFSQIDSSMRRRHNGAGLGLAITQRLCQLLGGSIAVESEVGRGSAFTVRLPDLSSEASAAPSRAA